jgi:hypothetical protein
MGQTYSSKSHTDGAKEIRNRDKVVHLLYTEHCQSVETPALVGNYL